MKKYLLATLLATFFTSMSFAQHSDIEFGFTDPSNPVFEIELDEVTDEGIQVAEGSFVPAGPFATTDNPGFITPAEEGLTVNQGDQVFVNILNAGAADSPTDVGVGFVNLFTVAGGIQDFDSSLGTLSITANVPGNPSADAISTFAGDDSLTGSTALFLAAGSDGSTFSDPPEGEDPEQLAVGNIHNHLGFDLDGTLAGTDGAIGLLLQFSSVLASNGETVESDPFFLILNNGLGDEDFEAALLAFGLDESASVPEPSTGIVLTGIAGAILTRRRRRVA